MTMMKTIPIDKITHALAVIVVAVGKELWDAQGHGTPDRIDALVTVYSDDRAI